MNITKTNYVLLQEIIQQQNWSPITEISDTNTAFKLFIEKLSLCVDDASNKISARKNQRSTFKKPWMTKQLLSFTGTAHADW